MFKKYSSIENHYRDKFIELAKTTVDKGTQWVLHEKIHGANFSVIVGNDKHYEFASRNGVVTDNSFNTDVVFDKKLLDSILACAEYVFGNKDKFSTNDFESIQFVGEIFGGSFEGMKTDPNAKKIQKGVCYSPKNHWFLFDIMMVSNGPINERHPEGLYSNYIPVSELELITQKFEIPSVPKVGIFNTLTEALQFDVESFVSVVSENLGYGKLDGNIAEGVVIKPYSKDYHFHTGERCVIKKKTEKFKEKGKNHTELVPVELSSEVKDSLSVFSQYLTENRIESAKSKFADIDDLSPLIREFVTDALKDFTIENPEKLIFSNDADNFVFKKEMNRMAVSYLKKNVLK